MQLRLTAFMADWVARLTLERADSTAHGVKSTETEHHGFQFY